MYPLFLTNSELIRLIQVFPLCYGFCSWGSITMQASVHRMLAPPCSSGDIHACNSVLRAEVGAERVRGELSAPVGGICTLSLQLAAVAGTCGPNRERTCFYRLFAVGSQSLQTMRPFTACSWDTKRPLPNVRRHCCSTGQAASHVPLYCSLSTR